MNTITASDLVNKLWDDLSLDINSNTSPVRDGSYALPSINFLRKEFAEWWQKCLAELPAYTAEAWDCDDYAMRCVTELSLCLWQNPASRGHGIGCFVAYVEMPNDEGHAMVLCLTHDSGWVLLEPQAPQHIYPIVISDGYEIQTPPNSPPAPVSISYVIV